MDNARPFKQTMLSWNFQVMNQFKVVYPRNWHYRNPLHGVVLLSLVNPLYYFLRWVYCIRHYDAQDPWRVLGDEGNKKCGRIAHITKYMYLKASRPRKCNYPVCSVLLHCSLLFHIIAGNAVGNCYPLYFPRLVLVVFKLSILSLLGLLD